MVHLANPTPSPDTSDRGRVRRVLPHLALVTLRAALTSARLGRGCIILRRLKAHALYAIQVDEEAVSGALVEHIGAIVKIEASARYLLAFSHAFLAVE